MPESGQLPPHIQAIQAQEQLTGMAPVATTFLADDTQAQRHAQPWANFPTAPEPWTEPHEAGRVFRLCARFFIALALVSTIGVIQAIVSGQPRCARRSLRDSRPLYRRRTSGNRLSEAGRG
jgi:hypothetical protein